MLLDHVCLRSTGSTMLTHCVSWPRSLDCTRTGRVDALRRSKQSCPNAKWRQRVQHVPLAGSQQRLSEVHAGNQPWVPPYACRTASLPPIEPAAPLSDPGRRRWRCAATGHTPASAIVLRVAGASNRFTFYKRVPRPDAWFAHAPSGGGAQIEAERELGIVGRPQLHAVVRHEDAGDRAIQEEHALDLTHNSMRKRRCNASKTGQGTNAVCAAAPADRKPRNCLPG